MGCKTLACLVGVATQLAERITAALLPAGNLQWELILFQSAGSAATVEEVKPDSEEEHL